MKQSITVNNDQVLLGKALIGTLKPTKIKGELCIVDPNGMVLGYVQAQPCGRWRAGRKSFVTVTAAVRASLRLRQDDPKRPHKYGAKRTEVDGTVFDSKREAARYVTLRAMLKAGAIEEMTLQPRWKLEVNGVHICDYVADFMYSLDGALVVEDVKGMKTPVYKLKKKLMRAIHGIEIKEV